MRRDDVITTLRAHERELNELGIRRVAVFGSVARGDDREDSDLDLVVTFSEPPRHSLIDVARVQRTLSALLGTEVDLAVEPLQTDRFRAHVERDLVRAFQRSIRHLEDLLANIARIERYVSGVDEEAFLLDDKTRDAVERNLQRISEAAIRLGPQAEALCPEIPWRDMRGIGNQLRHGYDRIDPHIIWRTVQQDLPSLQLAAMMALNRLEGEDPPDPS